jgi:hypothetical protein
MASRGKQEKEEEDLCLADELHLRRFFLQAIKDKLHTRRNTQFVENLK